MFGKQLLSWLMLAVVVIVQAEPILRIPDSTITLPIAKRVNGTSIKGNIPLRDKTRAQALRTRPSLVLQPEVVGSIPATNQAVDYVVSVS